MRRRGSRRSPGRSPAGGYIAGSSLVHLNETDFAAYVMSPRTTNGQYNRVLSPLEWAVFEDIGWRVVPEPGTLSLLVVAGLALLRRGR